MATAALRTVWRHWQGSDGHGCRQRDAAPPVTDLCPNRWRRSRTGRSLPISCGCFKRHGSDEVVLNLHHFPEVITRYLGDGARSGWTSATVGAGAARHGGKGEEERGLPRRRHVPGHERGRAHRHRSHGAAGATGATAPPTIAVKEVADPSQYGVMLTDDDGRVVGFQEKPSREEARSNLCNCGIYVFEPDSSLSSRPGQFDDFGSRLFPDMLKAGYPVLHPHLRRLLERCRQSREFPGQRRRSRGESPRRLPGREGAAGHVDGAGRPGWRPPYASKGPVVMGRGCQSARAP